MAAFASKVFTRRGERCRGYTYCDQWRALVASCCDDGSGSEPRGSLLEAISFHVFIISDSCSLFGGSELFFCRKEMNVAGKVFTKTFKLPLRVVVRVAG